MILPAVCLRIVPIVAAACALAACTTTASGPPENDSAAPRITVYAENGEGTPSFASDTTPTPGPAAEFAGCVKFSEQPAQFWVQMRDPGGVRAVNIRTLGGRILAQSIDTGLSPPEATTDIESNNIFIDLQPPSAGRVRTLVGIRLQVESLNQPASGDAAFAATFEAIDYNNNHKSYQVEAEKPDSPKICP